MNRIKSGRLLSLGAALLFAATSTRADDGRIGTIEISGNRRIAVETIRHQLPLRVGDAYDAAKANAALKALFATGQFADVRMTRDSSRLKVEVEEHPAIRRVAFDGHVLLDETSLKTAAGLEPGAPYSRAGGEVAKERVRERYRAKGHPDVVVDVQATETADNRVDIKIAIREGAGVKIEHVGFAGNRAFGATVLQDVITTRPAGLLDFLRPVPAPDDARLDYDRERLLLHYRANGFADVQVSPVVTTRDAATNGLRIVFTIDEGQRYRFGAVTMSTGSTGVLDTALRQHFAIATGEVWNATAIETTVERLTLALIERGAADVKVAAVPRRDVARAEIAIDLVLAPTPRLAISRIEITGNARTKDVVIRRELSFSEGEAFHPLLAERARKRLLGLGLFKTVDIKAVRTKDTAADKELVVVEISVVEQDSRELGYGAGYSSSEGITGDISVTERNLLGNGQYLRVMLAGSERRAEGEIGFTEPYFLGHRLAAGFDLFYRTTDNSISSSYKSTRFGGDIRVGAEIADNTRASVTYTLSRNTISDVGAGASAAIRQAVPGLPGAKSATYDASSIGYAMTYDTRDRVASPMRGVYVSAGQDLAGFGGDVRYLKSSAEARGYLPVGERAVLATRAAGGTISGWGGSEVRLLDMFYKGGETVRGFAAGGIGPRDLGSSNRDALGGTSFVATSAELRFPLPFTPADFGLRAAVFADAGSLWGSSRSVKSVSGVVGTTAALRASTGAGLIWDSPVGPLRVDYARVLVKQPYDKTQAWRFGLMPF